MLITTLGRRAERESAAAATRPRPVDPAQAAWIAAAPCALLVALAVLLLGPPLADLQPQAAGPSAFWPGAPLLPEPVEHARYLIALAGPFLLSGVVLAAARRRLALRPATVRAAALASAAALCSFLALCLLAQNSVLLRAHVPPALPTRFFDLRTLVVAALLALLLAAGLRRGVALPRALRGEGRPLRSACLATAALLTALWLLTAINTDATIARAPGYDLLPWSMAETFAVLNGRTPLADFHSQYSQLWPYAGAIVLALTSATTATWTTTMVTISGLALLAVYATFRRVARSPVLALALYAPFLATSFFMLTGPPENRFTPAGIFSAWPLRYAGPYLLAWLVARHCEGATPRRALPLFAVAGLVAVNNPELGLGALAGAVLAVACACRPASARALARLAGAVAGGLAVAIALVALLTLARSGELPELGLLSEFPRIYGVDGWFIGPMAPIGLHTALYVTFAATLVTAVVRAARGADDPVLTGLLAWSGAFGLVAGSYYVGASNPLTLGTLFSAWCFALALLTVVVVRALATRPGRWPTGPELAVLLGFGLAACSLAQLPAPWAQLERLRDRTEPIYEQRAAMRSIGVRVEPGQKVAILLPLGHRIAYELGIVNVSPYSGPAAMPKREQLRTTIAAMRREGARSAFVDAGNRPQLVTALQRAGFTVRGDANPVELVDGQ